MVSERMHKFLLKILSKFNALERYFRWSPTLIEYAVKAEKNLTSTETTAIAEKSS